MILSPGRSRTERLAGLLNLRRQRDELDALIAATEKTLGLEPGAVVELPQREQVEQMGGVRG